MKVLLINPPSDSPQPIMPLGLAYIAAALEMENIHVKVIDGWAENLDFDALEKRIEKEGAIDLVGITIMSPTYSTGIKVIKTVKKVSPKSKIIAGGTHPSSLPKECLQDNPELDFVLVGEGEEVIVQLIKSLSNLITDYGRIKGLVYRFNGKIIWTGRANPVKNLNNLPFPARHLFPLDKYITHPPYRLFKEYATMVTSRGCPFCCTYCTKSVSGQHYRYQSADRVVKEIEFLIKNFNIKQIHFYDDDFTINMERVNLLCDEIIRKKIKLKWSCVTRVDLVNEELLKKMKKSGCWLISYGVESGSQVILNSIGKGYRIKQIKKAFSLTRKTKIRTLGYFMAGLPGETKSSLKKTVDLSLSLHLDFVSWSVTALYPGSILYRQALEGKLGNNYIQVNKPVTKSLKNVSSLSPYAHGHIYIYNGKLSGKYITETVNFAYRKFYLRVNYLIYFIIKLQTFTELLSYFKALTQVVRWKKNK